MWNELNFKYCSIYMRIERVLISADLFSIVVFLYISAEDYKTYKLISKNVLLTETIYCSHNTYDRKFTCGFRLRSEFCKKIVSFCNWFSISDKSPPKDWPAKGTVAFDRVFLSYASNEQPVLRNVTLTIGSAEKVRIVCHC